MTTSAQKRIDCSIAAVCVHQQQAAAIDAIDNDATDGAEHQARHELAEAAQPELGGGAGELEDQPRLRHRLQEVARVRDDGAGEEQREVAVTQRGKAEAAGSGER